MSFLDERDYEEEAANREELEAEDEAEIDWKAVDHAMAMEEGELI